MILKKNVVVASQSDIGGASEVMLKIAELTKERMRNKETEYRSGISVGILSSPRCSVSQISFSPGLYLAQLALYDSELLELIFSHKLVTKLEPSGGRSMRWGLFYPDLNNKDISALS